MNYWELAAWIAAAAMLAAAAWYRKKFTEANKAIKVYNTLISRIEEFGNLRLSLVWNPAINRWQVADPHLKGPHPDQARILATEEHWSAAIQNAVHKKRSIMDTQKLAPIKPAKPAGPPGFLA